MSVRPASLVRPMGSNLGRHSVIIRRPAPEFCGRVLCSSIGRPWGFSVQGSSGVTTLLFTDIEGSARLWEQQAEGMSRALAEHDTLSRKAVEGNRGVVVKMTGDGMYAAFSDPLDALNATALLQQGLAELAA